MKRSRVSKKLNKVVIIRCEWDGYCCSQCHSDLELNRHIEEHFEQYKLIFQDCEEFVCPWALCNFNSQCLLEMERHLYYHGYYAGLLAQGKLACKNCRDIPKCNAPAKESIPIPELKRDFRCEWANCERLFASVVEFHDHIVQHANFDYEIQKSPDNEHPRKLQCHWGYCKKVSENKYRLIEHIRTHTNKKNFGCFQCGELFCTRTTLFDHLRRQPENNTHNHQCAQCFKFFSTEKLLRAHVINHVNCFKCSLCDMTCSSLSTLATHVRYRHLKDKPFKCSECNLRWVRECDLAKHVQHVHTKEVHRCDQPGCYYAVASYNLLRRHFLEVHDNMPFIYVCHCCDKPFKTGKTLSSHLIKKHDFQLPSGHKRFTYRVDENGFYRLETMRIESLEVTKKLKLSPNPFENKEVTQDSSCYEIVSMTNENDERIIVSNDPVEAHLVGEVVISLPTIDELSNGV